MSIAFIGAAEAISPVSQDAFDHIAIETKVYSHISENMDSDTKMFPKPQQGNKQHILALPKLEDESNYMIEVQFGQNQMVDCNQHRLMGSVELKTLDGWGYSYYQVDKVLDGSSTMRMCTEPEKAQFVMLGEGIKMAYDSRLAKVFYLPENIELRYRIWQVSSEFRFSGQQ
ncbi:serine protease inhibitor ecotin [Shewanella aestuarii]|uniref:Serine protease inhibitor ecotin n=1 Tax=Shewanella aestuarii TaxID=1028752 RepID=A0A6G9QKM4_9GAMM|nr:serine protease inhibitor ecotin [Shewanella aestuarii]QIR14615.1 serine protease inhibitor ecotin [Shewanella aestuarii]